MNKKADNQQLIKDYYAAYEKKDWSILQRILADDFTFTSPAGDDRINIKTYKEKCWPNAENTKKFEIEAVFADDTSGLATYNGYNNAGKLFRNTSFSVLKMAKYSATNVSLAPVLTFRTMRGSSGGCILPKQKPA